jgi:hypothetical protein
MLKRYFIFGAALLGTVFIAAGMKTTPRTDKGRVDHSQYLKFSHRFHVEEQGIACEDCHTTATSSKLSSDNLLGDHSSCQTCHEEQISSDCAFCHTTPDNVVPIPKPTPELIFSHERHLTENIECQTCHVGVETVDYVTSKNMPSMVSCMTCHAEKKISTNCETCHTNFTSLVPEDHLVADFRKRHKELTRVAMMDVSCATCHTSESFCQDCHTGAELTGFGLERDLMPEPSARGSVKDSPKQLRLQQVHALNYRFTHGFDAKSRLVDCSSCHEQQSFCATCHQAGGNVTQIKFKPENHKIAGFARIGRGSGGGLHAELARRDIENCMSCHDVQGNDPTCFACHTETGAVR